MAQSTFKEVLDKLYFGSDINISSGESLLTDLKNCAGLQVREKVSQSKSLGVYLDVPSTEMPIQKTYVFQMLRSPIDNYKIDSGYIKIKITQTKTQQKVSSVEWSTFFEQQNEAEDVFNRIKQMFIAVSTKYKFDVDDELEYGKLAQFSTQNSTDGVKGVTIMLFKSKIQNGYEVRIFPFNELTDN